MILCKISCDFKDVCSLILTCKNTAGTTGLTMEAVRHALVISSVIFICSKICHLAVRN